MDTPRESSVPAVAVRWLPARSDWMASLVVCFVALPLSLGIALASGAPPSSGLITAVIGGVVGGTLAGAPLSVAGPAAGLAALVYQFVREFGLEGLAVITALAGVLQVALGLARAGRFVERVPRPVLEGMLSAIGLLILFGQLHVLTGAPMPASFVDGFRTLPAAVGRSLASVEPGPVLPSGLPSGLPILACGLLAVVVQLSWPRIVRGAAATIPPALPAVALATLASLVFEMPRVELEPLLPSVAGDLRRFLGFDWIVGLSRYIIPAAVLAVVASAESLLSARAVDQLAAARGLGMPPSRPDRELVAQGVTNAISGMLGGLPATGVIVRSAVNLNAGGRTRWSTILHGAWIATFVGLFPGVLERIPLTALAAVLMVTGARLLNLSRLKHELRHDPTAGALWVLTTAAIVTTDLLRGLMIGLVAAALAPRIARLRPDRPASR